MHQHPRAPPVTASAARSEATNPERTNNQRDPQNWSRETEAPRNSVAEVNRLNQVIQNFHTKAALIILHSRFELAPAYAKGTRRLNKWFNVELDETEEYRDEIRPWKTCDFKEHRPSPLVIEVFIDSTDLTPKQTLVLLDDHGKRWDVLEALASDSGRGENEVVLERWIIELGETSDGLPPDLNIILPLVYKKSIVLFRSLYTYAAFLPAWKLARSLQKYHPHGPLKLAYRIRSDGSRSDDGLSVPLSDSDASSQYSFGVTDSPAGPFSVRVQYRLNCEFRVDDSESILSSRFMGADEDLFRPSIDSTKADHLEAGSLPTKTRVEAPPDLGQAYGSLSTFHQVGVSGTSPISALRHAQELDSASDDSPRRSLSKAGQSPSRDGVRRPSFSFHPFKTPVLSASPSLQVSRPSSRALETLREGKDMPPPAAPAVRLGTEAGSANSRPQARYSSSFSHRRARLSRDEEVSSGKTSAASSANPGSGVIPDASSYQDDENISDFIKMLESKRDLLTPADSTAAEASSRRTTAALNRYHRMRESNVALSESMSLSLHRSTSSRQLSNVPPMIAATSVSTSSSAGKPISPHTPHTPAIPSRLSANSIVDYHQVSEGVHLSEEAPSDATVVETQTVPPIDIPTSPRLLVSYRRSSSVAQRRANDQTDFGQRSASMGARPAEARQEPERSVAGPEKEPTPQKSADSGSLNLYRSRLARGGRVGGTPGSDSGGSGSLERRRPGRSSFSRPDGRTEDDDFLPFAMSDIGASRRSLEEARGSLERDRTESRRGSRRAGVYPPWGS